MVMKNSNAWILIIAITAFGAGVAQYYLTVEAPETVTPVATDAGSNRSPIIFRDYESPKVLPEFNFVDGGGRELNLDAFRGKLVLLNIWATWCIPCRKEMPTLDRLQAKLGGPNFEVVALSIDRGGVEMVKDFYAEFGLKFLAIYVDTTIAVSYRLNVPGIPATLLVNPEGKEIGRVIGPAEWDSPKVIKEIRSHLPPI